MKMLSRLLRDESGATAIEYGLIVCIIVIGIIVSVQSIGQNFVVNVMTNVSTGLAR